MKSALVNISRQTFRADVARNVFTRARGLSGRPNMAEDEAMLFTFPIAMRYSFWMKGMKFPLDIVWIRNGLVADVSENVPMPTPGLSILGLSGFRPKVAVDTVLEMNAGLVRKFGIRAGDAVEVVMVS